jgi:dTDP-glucose 4,6-dehydratase
VVFAWIRRNIGGQALFDFASWFFSVYLAGVLRYEFDLSKLDSVAFLALALSLGVAGFVVGKIIGLYRSRFKPASFDELLALLTSSALTGVPFAVAVYFFGVGWGIPRSLLLIIIPLFLLASGAARTWRRFYLASVQKPQGAKRALVFGAGHMAEILIPQLLQDPQSVFLPVGLLDDDLRKSNRWIAGVKMQGSFDHLASAVRKTGAEVLIVAIPRATSETLQQISVAASPLNLEILVLPSFSEILGSSGRDIILRELGIEDLVGRRAVTIDSPQVSSMISGKTVLVTGAGGSIGLELCKQVATFGPRRLIFLDRDETGLQQAQLATQKSGLLDTPNVVLADIRDADAIHSIFAHLKPELFFMRPPLNTYRCWKTSLPKHGKPTFRAHLMS